MAHASDSSVQQNAEAVMLKWYSQRHGVHVEPRRIDLPSGSFVHVDGVATNESGEFTHLVEVYARVGVLKGGQLHKIARDALKLLTLRAAMTTDAQLTILLASPDAEACVTGRSWLSDALRANDISVEVAEIDEGLQAQIGSAQDTQKMVNPAPPVEPEDEEQSVSPNP